MNDFNDKLNSILLNTEIYNNTKQEDFFKRYVKKIKYKISLQSFGLGYYYLYLRPINLNEIDFKLLLNNTFKKISYPVQLGKSNSFIIKYLFPYRNPNKAYINWILKSKKNLSEYCFFNVKKFYQILHFEYNLSLKGWNLDTNRFKTHIQRILFDKSYRNKPLNLNQIDIGDLNVSEIYGPMSNEYKDLLEIYNWNPVDLKSIIGSRKYTLRDKILGLIKNNLILPYLKLKNLDFKERITIIIPGLDNEQIRILMRVFSFFNLGFIHQIEGEFYIFGFEEEKKFDNGLYIKLYLPDCELSDFQRLFDKLFQFLSIEKYLILNDMVDGKTFLNSVFEDLDFLKSYNPLKNLLWSKQDKKWLNHKLFGENFEPKYPKLIPDEPKEN